jgi:hypothetical protein
MRTKTTTLLVFGLLLIFATAAAAGEETKTVMLTGKIACAKCKLDVADAKGCQPVLVVKSDADGEPSYYYLVDNDVSEKFGHACASAKAAMVTGTVVEKDNKMWLTASKIEEAKGA